MSRDGRTNRVEFNVPSSSPSSSSVMNGGLMRRNHFESYSTIVLGCGDNSKYQLAAKNRGVYDELMPLCNVEELLMRSRLAEMACGEKHAIMLLENGRVLSIGDNSYCQLALDQFYLSEVNKFTKSSLRDEIVKVSSKFNHSIFLTREGRLYSCSNVNHCGQLGIGSFMSTNVCYPISCFFGGNRNSVLYHLPNKTFKVVDIATGKNHSLFIIEKLTNEGRKEFYLFGCGDSSMGQLSKLQGYVNSPQEIKKFDGPIKKIDCGSNHSAVLLESGKLFLFGSNEKNQCATQGVCKITEPFAVEGTFRDVYCGVDHTVMVASDEIYITNSKLKEPISRRVSPHVKIASISTLNSKTVLLTQNETCVFVNILNSEGEIESAWEYSQNRVIPKQGPDFNTVRKPKHDHSCECGCITTKLRLFSGQDFLYIIMEKFCHTIYQKLGNGVFSDIQIKTK